MTNEEIFNIIKPGLDRDKISLHSIEFRISELCNGDGKRINEIKKLIKEYLEDNNKYEYMW